MMVNISTLFSNSPSVGFVWSERQCQQYIYIYNNHFGVYVNTLYLAYALSLCLTMPAFNLYMVLCNSTMFMHLVLLIDSTMGATYGINSSMNSYYSYYQRHTALQTAIHHTRVFLAARRLHTSEYDGLGFNDSSGNISEVQEPPRIRNNRIYMP